MSRAAEYLATHWFGVLLLGIGAWQLWVNPLFVVHAPEVAWLVRSWFGLVFGLLCLALVLWVAFKVVTTPSRLPFAGVTPPWVAQKSSPVLSRK